MSLARQAFDVYSDELVRQICGKNDELRRENRALVSDQERLNALQIHSGSDLVLALDVRDDEVDGYTSRFYKESAVKIPYEKAFSLSFSIAGVDLRLDPAEGARLSFRRRRRPKWMVTIAGTLSMGLDAMKRIELAVSGIPHYALCGYRAHLQFFNGGFILDLNNWTSI